MEADSSKSKSQNIINAKLSNDDQLRALKIAMVFGANASGKSTLIRAFYNFINFIYRKPNVGEGVWMYDPYLFDKNYIEKSTEFELTFIDSKGIKCIYKVEFNRSQILLEKLDYYPKGSPTNLFTRKATNDASVDIHTVNLGASLDKKEFKVFSNQLLLSKFGSDEPIEELTNIYQYFRKYEIINNLNIDHKTKLAKHISKTLIEDPSLKIQMEHLIRFADTKINGIHIDKNETPKENATSPERPHNPYSVYGIHKVYDETKDTNGSAFLPFDNESIGTQALYILGGAILLTLQRGGVLIVDELDASLHPYLTRMIVMMFQSEKLNPSNAQIIFTTHDMTLLDRDLIRRDQIWLTEKKETGTSEMFSLQDFDGIREETPFDKWYLAGKFGGLPSLKSIDSMFENEPSLS